MQAHSILAIDQGTTSTRVLHVDVAGRVMRMAARAVDTVYPADGWVEQDPCAILAGMNEAVAECLSGATKPSAIAITNQRETVLLWERGSGQPLSPAVTWLLFAATSRSSRRMIGSLVLRR